MTQAIIIPELCDFGYVATSASGWEPGEPIGWGWTKAEALSDLVWQLREQEP